MTQRELEQRLPTIVHTIAQSISSSPNIRYEGRFPLPQRGKVIECVNLLQKIAYPGYFEESVAAADGIESHVGALINELTELLYQQVHSISHQACYGYPQDHCTALLDDLNFTRLQRAPAPVQWYAPHQQQ